jgi:formylglycine-generating enzyme required for sulfatase activity
MTQSRDDIYQSLAEGQLVGPDHHKFQLQGESTLCPLGQLWEADDVSTKNAISVNLIMLDPIFLVDKSFLAKFKKQIVRSKAINHSHIADVYGYFIHRGGLLFFAFEPVDGLTLDQLIVSGGNKSLTLKQTQGLLTQLTGAVNGCAKQWHLPFAAIDSEFVYVNKKGGVKLLPISMYEFFHETKDLPKQVYAYKSFCSPQALSDQKIDSSSDSYTLAAVAYALLSGHTFDGNDSVDNRKEASLSRPNDISDQQWDALQKALDAEPNNRFSQPAEFIKQFFPAENTLQSGPTANTPELEDSSDKSESPPSTSANKKAALINKIKNIRIPKLIIALAILLFGIGIGFILGVFSSSAKIDAVNAKYNDLRIQEQEQQSQLHTTLKLLKKTRNESQRLRLKNKALNDQFKNFDSGSAVPLSIFRDPISDGIYGPDMIVLSPNTFTMGDISGIGNDNEKPAHSVSLKHKFSLSRFEITFAQYDQFAHQTGRKLPSDEGWGRGKQPVINVSWRDANAYTRWLAEQTKLPYRLPSEAEWEYVARAGTKTNYWWGDENETGYSHCNDCGDPLGGKQPLAVGSMQPNPWGFHDMNGNVDEWVQDCYREDYTKISANGRAFQIPGCANRSMRGGSWFDLARITRSASRYRHPPDARRNTWGFRVALDIKE